MSTALETISEQLAELEQLRAKTTELARREAELDEREAAVAQAAEQPWGKLAVIRAEQLGIEQGRQQAIVIIDQSLAAWSGINQSVAIALRSIKKQICSL